MYKLDKYFSITKINDGIDLINYHYKGPYTLNQIYDMVENYFPKAKYIPQLLIRDNTKLSIKIVELKNNKYLSDTNEMITIKNKSGNAYRLNAYFIDIDVNYNNYQIYIYYLYRTKFGLPNYHQMKIHLLHKV